MPPPDYTVDSELIKSDPDDMQNMSKADAETRTAELTAAIDKEKEGRSLMLPEYRGYNAAVDYPEDKRDRLAVLEGNLANWTETFDEVHTIAAAETAASATDDQRAKAWEAALEQQQAAEEAKWDRLWRGMDAAEERFKWATSRPQFKEQCFLLSNVFALTDHKKEKDAAAGHYQRKWLPYHPEDGNLNASLLIEGDPYRLMNRLTQYPSQQYFHNIMPHELSHLQPMIRLFKVGTDPSNAKEELQEFKFDSHLTPTDVSDILSNSRTRGVGVGIQNFTFSYEADNPFAIKKAIKGRLTIFANSFDELLRDRGGYTYADLALKTGSPLTRNYAAPQQPDVVYDNLDKLNFRLKAVVGWSIPKGNTAFTTPGALDAINDSFITLNLTPTIHEFDIDDLGRVKFIINYLAYVEDYFDQSEFNIFTDPDVAYNIMARKLKYQTHVSNCETADRLKEVRKEEQEQVEHDKKAATKALMTAMSGKCLEDGTSTSLIYVLEMPYVDINQWKNEGPYYDFGDHDILGSISLGISESWMADVVDSAQSEPEPEPEPVEPGFWDRAFEPHESWKTLGTRLYQGEGPKDEFQNSTHIPYFYVSDLVDVVLYGIHFQYSPDGLITAVDDVEEAGDDEKAAEKERIMRSREQFERLRVVLGPLEITDPKNPEKSRYVSIGDLPISVKYFIEWLTEKVIKTEAVIYTLSQFLNEFLNELIREFLNNDECFNGQLRQPTRLSQAAITSYREAIYNADGSVKIKSDEITNVIEPAGTRRLKTTDIADSPLLNIAGERSDPRGVPADGGLNREINYLVYFAGRIMPAEQATGDAGSDAQKGIFHYGIGRDRGLVKTINFKKTSAKGLKELRFEQQGYDGLQQLREQYDVEIKSFANVNTFPGVYIYVDPFSVSPSSDIDLTQMGIGGYHMIIRSEHSFGPGIAESTITAKWVAEKYVGTSAVLAGEADPKKKCAGRGTG